MTYGLATKDLFVGGPNGFGAFLSAVQVALSVLLPKTPQDDKTAESAHNSDADDDALLPDYEMSRRTHTSS